MSVFNVATPVHSYASFELANKIFQAAMVTQAVLERCPSNLSRLLGTLDDMHPDYSNDMTLTVKYKAHVEELIPSDDEVRQAFAAYIVVFAAYRLDLDWHMGTNGKTTYEDLMSGKFFDKDISFFYGAGERIVCISDVVLLASAIAGLDLSRWPSDKVKAVVGESLNPVEYEALATAISSVAAANEACERMSAEIRSVYMAKMNELVSTVNQTKSDICQLLYPTLKKNIACNDVSQMIEMFIAKD